MFDHKMRLTKEKWFGPLAERLRRWPPWLLTLLGFGVGLAVAVAVAQQQYLWGFLLWFFNRVFDGLDGTVARLQNSQTDLGGYLDILLDFVVYACIPIGLAWGRPSPPLYLSLAFLLAVYYVNAASWMYLSAILEKRATHDQRQMTTVQMPAGLIGGTETILMYTVWIAFPHALFWLFNLMTLLVALTIGQRLLWAVRHLDQSRSN